MDIKNFICQYIEQNKEIFQKVSDEVWAYAEPGMKEYKSAKCLEDTLESFGFSVTTGLAEIPTAFVGSWGKGAPVIGFLGEFDALPGLSQKSGCATASPLTTENGAYGHGCGHHLLGAGALAAACALKAYLEQNNLPGTVKYFGCPGEEYGSGKAFMAREGCFNDVDCCFTWHGNDANSVVARGSLACYSAFFRFKGRTAHAAGAPHLGRSALDACEIMNVGVNYLREHIISDARVHYAYRDVGGIAPNVVQDHAETHYFIRAPRLDQMMPIVERVKDIARGAALMTGTEMEFITHEALTDFLPNDTLNQLCHKALEEIGLPSYTDEEMAVANEFFATITSDELKNAAENYKTLTGGGAIPKGPINDVIAPLHSIDKAMSGSTDVGDVSYCTPTAQFNIATQVIGTPGHTWQITGQGTTGYAHKGMLTAAKAMALSAALAMADAEIIEKAKCELSGKNGGGYNCPLPQDLKPTL